MDLCQVVQHLDSYLRTDEIDDSSLNGLQVETDRDVTRVAAAVDASFSAFARAREAGAQLLLVHHGLFWGKAPLRGPLYRRVKFLIDNEMGLYAAHLPLDMHPEVGNNAQLAKMIGLENARPFLRYRGSLIGLVGEVEETSLQDLASTVERCLGSPVKLLEFGKRKVVRVAICSGGAGSDLIQAVEAGADVYLTGEASHEAATLARDAGINVVFGGHYATETLGPKALARHVQDALGIPSVFIESPTGI
ncbi:MAG: Nif3-like dinuclear metal center hexameric protein [Firmicutes bacterium]|jgi:dinuclear metal center YbgI/SA1388 family protein|nr:Nif3-like dinuclear metal center hexameric protein [Bacillota bacterium]MDH7496693.1 Nif3-like dinuclear metal center hexameric protein [Bacillota bacterium]